MGIHNITSSTTPLSILHRTFRSFQNKEFFFTVGGFQIPKLKKRTLRTPTIEMRETEDLVQKAALYIKQARTMREFANLKVQQAQCHMDEGVEQCDASRCLVMDYAQNGQMPFLGNVQPGATYYYTPLRINIFGLGDPTTPMEKGTGYLDCYVYETRSN